MSHKRNLSLIVTQEKPVTEGLTLLRSTAPFSEEKLADVCIELKDFMAATKLVQPSAKREGFATGNNGYCTILQVIMGTVPRSLGRAARSLRHTKLVWEGGFPKGDIYKLLLKGSPCQTKMSILFAVPRILSFESSTSII